ncbi:MAG: hypothetical protein HRU28_01335 [Rhizobiales bacterium]|nr:hypothetical protein [Hyphomicrobiales bacterium]
MLQTLTITNWFSLSNDEDQTALTSVTISDTYFLNVYLRTNVPTTLDRVHIDNLSITPTQAIKLAYLLGQED